MIKLEKLDEPDVLVENGANWLKVLEDKDAAGEVASDYEKSRYRHPQIKQVLYDETHGKCAYCESFLRHIAYGDVEHIVPKSGTLAKSFLWTNLTLACDVCNTGKAKHHEIVDPYSEEPADHFVFAGPMIVPKTGSEKALNTERRLKLNRIELMERRSERLKIISDRLLLIHQAQGVEVKAALKDDLEHNEVGDDTEYAAFVRSFLITMQAMK